MRAAARRLVPDAFVVKLRPSGRALAYGTFLGGKQTEAAGGIAVDRAGNAYLAGSTQSPDFPVIRALQPRIDNRSCSTTGPPEELCNDAFVTKLSADGQRLRYSTFLGGNGEDQGLGIAVDRAGAAHVAGSTDSRTLGIAAPVQATLGGGIDAYLAVIAPTGALRANAAPSTRAAASMWRVARFRRTSRSLRRCRAYLRATATCS